MRIGGGGNLTGPQKLFTEAVFVGKHLSDPFYLEGTNRMSLRDTIFREVASNILIHREYINAFPAKLIIERGQVKTENASKPHGFGVLQAETFTPFPKNPVIAGFFRQIGRADELGPGMRKMMRYGKAYGGAAPELIENDIFKIIIRYPDTTTYPERPAIIKITDQAQDSKGARVGARVEARVNCSKNCNGTQKRHTFTITAGNRSWA